MIMGILTISVALLRGKHGFMTIHWSQILLDERWVDKQQSNLIYPKQKHIEGRGFGNKAPNISIFRRFYAIPVEDPADPEVWMSTLNRKPTLSRYMTKFLFRNSQCITDHKGFWLTNFLDIMGLQIFTIKIQKSNITHQNSRSYS